MRLEELKFAEGEFDGQDISSLDDRPKLSASELKAMFDNVGKNMLALGRFNALIDWLLANNEDIEEIKAKLATVDEALAAAGEAQEAAEALLEDTQGITDEKLAAVDEALAATGQAQEAAGQLLEDAQEAADENLAAVDGKLEAVDEKLAAAGEAQAAAEALLGSAQEIEGKLATVDEALAAAEQAQETAEALLGDAQEIDERLADVDEALAAMQQLQTRVQTLENENTQLKQKAKIKLMVYAESGKTVTLSKSGSSSQTFVVGSTMQAERELDATGEWTVSCTYGNRTYSKTLSVEGPGVTQVALAPDLETASWGFIDLVGSVGLAKTCWAIGDTKEIMVGSGEGNAAVLLDFDHDVLSEPNPKGVGKKAAMTFGLAQPLQTKAAMHSVAESTDWANRDMITTYLPARYEDLGTYEPELYNVIKTVQKVIMTPCSDVSTDSGWQAIGGAEAPLDCELFLFSEREIFGSNRYSIPFYSYEEPYELYKWGYPFIQPMDYWLRSTYFYTGSDCSKGAVVVRGDSGWMRGDTLTALNGVLYGFCV